MKKILIVLLILACAQVTLGQLSGSLSGILGPGTYHVVDTISIESGNTLRLVPGTTFIFDGAYPLEIYGTLLAEGNENDSVIFTATTNWRGMRFNDPSSSESQLDYCLIEKGDTWYGGGVYCYYSWPTFFHCTIRDNRAWAGGGIYCDRSSPMLTNCTITGNTATQSNGGGVYCSWSSPTFSYCTINYNTTNDDAGGIYAGSDSSPIFSNCTINGNSATSYNSDGGGILCGSQSTANFLNCTIEDNSAQSRGGGIFSHGSEVFTDCIISNNSSENGGGIYCDRASRFINCTIENNIVMSDEGSSGAGVNCYSGSSSIFTNCTFVGNLAQGTSARGGGACIHYLASPTFINCTFSGNGADEGGGVYCSDSSPTFNSTIIAHSIGAGFYFLNSFDSQIEYCNVFGNIGGDIIYPSQGPPGIGNITTTNANNDPCDQYYNIFLDPMFVDVATSDFHLGDYSPCIGAADPINPPPNDMDGNPRPNPPGSLPDIGAYEHWRDVPLPVEMTTFQAFASDGQVVLRWQTASELNNNHFVLYKRRAGQETFQVLTQIPGFGTTSEPHDYEFIDQWVQNSTTYEYQISDVDLAGHETFHQQIVTATPDRNAVPFEFALYPNWPNPFNPTTTIRYDVEEAGLVSLKIFDLLGREVATLTHEEHSAGVHSVTWDAAGMPSGVYLCRMDAEGFVQTRKMVLVK